MTRNWVRRVVLTSILGYALLVLFVLITWMAIRLMTGYYPSLNFFVLSPLTFRLFELNQVFVIVPLLATIFVMISLLRTSISMRIASGLALTSYYFFAALVFAVFGSGEFPYEILVLWLPLTFFIGFLSAVVVDQLER